VSSETDFILNKARHFCSYQERCIREVADKLREWMVRPPVAEKILEQLIGEDYLNEERFARSFAGGKFRNNHWGKTKIIYELERRGVPDLIIQIGLEEIETREYEDTLHDLLTRKNRELKDKDPMIRKKKLISFAVQKGYDYPSIKRIIAGMVK
jgi:regulatory protein